eukprot:352678-Chlamydomonas_euryale.AAC.5
MMTALLCRTAPAKLQRPPARHEVLCVLNGVKQAQLKRQLGDSRLQSRQVLHGPGLTRLVDWV